MNFEDIKKNRSNALAALQTKIENQKKKKDYKDTRFWKPTPDAAGNRTATIRFLPNPASVTDPYVTIHHHFFQGENGKWYIQNCPLSLGSDHKCPVCEANRDMWDDDNEAAKDLCRARGRRAKNICNIYVVSDPQNKENEGKVFLFEINQTILKKINEAAASEGKNIAEGEFVFDPFDMWEGANFKIVSHGSGKMTKYDMSKFLNPTPFLKGDEKALKQVVAQLHDLSEFVAPSNFKSYDELKEAFDATFIGTGEATMTMVDEPATKSANPARSVSVKELFSALENEDEN